MHCLHYLNVEKKLAHLDFKCENLVLSKEFGVSIIDFGMTEQIAEPQKDPDKMSPRYRAPEIILEETFEPSKADIFGLGLALF